MNRSGLTLLETMVALMILGLVVVGFLELFGTTARSTNDLELWSRAVAHAENAMELVKIDPNYAYNSPRASLPDGFERLLDVRPWVSGLAVATITIQFPDGGTFTMSRLLENP